MIGPDASSGVKGYLNKQTSPCPYWLKYRTDISNPSTIPRNSYVLYKAIESTVAGLSTASATISPLSPRRQAAISSVPPVSGPLSFTIPITITSVPITVAISRSVPVPIPSISIPISVPVSLAVTVSASQLVTISVSFPVEITVAVLSRIAGPGRTASALLAASRRISVNIVCNPAAA